MAVKQISLDQLADELGAYADEAVETLEQAVFLGCLASLPDLVRSSPVDTGQYANSWDVERDPGVSVVIGNFAPHAAVIENGARPFTPPIKPLLEWAKRVLNDRSQPPEYSPEVWALARGTQQKIAAEGMAPKHVLEKAVPTILQNIRRELDSRGRL